MINYAITLSLNPPILDTAHTIWNELQHKFNINYISSRSPFPHITLCAGSVSSRMQRTKEYYVQFMQAAEAFELQANGFGVLLLDSPLIYIRWIPNKALLRCLSLARRCFIQMDARIEPSYSRQRWFAKTTLGYKDTNYIGLEKVLQYVALQPCCTPMPVNRVSLMRYSPSGESLIHSLSIN